MSVYLTTTEMCFTKEEDMADHSFEVNTTQALGADLGKLLLAFDMKY